MKLSKTTKWIIGLSVLLIIALVFVFKLYTEKRQYKLQVKALQDTTVNYRNKHGELVTQNTAFAGSVSDLKSQVKAWKSKGDTLRSQVNSSTRQISLLKQKLRISGTGEPDIIRIDTTIIVADNKIDSPTYNVNRSDEYHSFQFAGNQKKYAYDIKVYPTTELVTEDMGNKGTKVTAISRNPYVYEQDTKTVVVPYPKRTFWQRSKDILIGVAAASVLLLAK